MNQREYREVYLRSEHWQKMRQEALEWAAYRCQVCFSPNDLHVHHRTYDRLGQERLSDLTVLCRNCHVVFHETPAQRRSLELASAVDVARLLAILAAHPDGITVPQIRGAARDQSPPWDAQPKAIKAELLRMQEAGQTDVAKGGIWTLGAGRERG